MSTLKIDYTGSAASFTDGLKTPTLTEATASAGIAVGTSGTSAFILDNSDSLSWKDSGGTPQALIQVTSGNVFTIGNATTDPGLPTFPYQASFNIAQGTAPFKVTSTTVVTNLNADLLDGVQGSSYVQTSRTISTNAGLTGGGALSANRTLGLDWGTPNLKGLLYYTSATAPMLATMAAPSATVANLPYYNASSWGYAAAAGATTAGVLTTTGTSVSFTSGPLTLDLGGTGTNITAAAGAVAYSTASGISLNTPGVAGQALISGGTGTPTWGAITAVGGGTGLTSTFSPVSGVFYVSDANTMGITAAPTASAINALYVNSSGTYAWASTTTAGALVTNATTASWTTAGNAGQFLVAGGTGVAPGWSTNLSLSTATLQWLNGVSPIINQANASGAGSTFTISAQTTTGSNVAAGTLALAGGSTGTSTGPGNGGDITLTGGNSGATSTSHGGDLTLTAGNASNTGAYANTGGYVTITGGVAAGQTGTGGYVSITGGNTTYSSTSTTNTGGAVNITGGTSAGQTGVGGAVTITGGTASYAGATAKTGGAVLITGGAATAGTVGTGGSVTIASGSGAMFPGEILLKRGSYTVLATFEASYVGFPMGHLYSGSSSTDSGNGGRDFRISAQSTSLAGGYSGGSLYLSAGNATISGGTGGSISISTGSGFAVDGELTISRGSDVIFQTTSSAMTMTAPPNNDVDIIVTAGTGAVGGNVVLTSGYGALNAGYVSIKADTTELIRAAADDRVYFPVGALGISATASSITPYDFQITGQSTSATTIKGGSVVITAGNTAASATYTGGDIILNTGNGADYGTFQVVHGNGITYTSPLIQTANLAGPQYWVYFSYGNIGVGSASASPRGLSLVAQSHSSTGTGGSVILQSGGSSGGTSGEITLSRGGTAVLATSSTALTLGVSGSILPTFAATSGKPFAVNSGATTKVDYLNSDLWDGFHITGSLAAGSLPYGSSTANTFNFLAIGGYNQVLQVGANNLPVWVSQIDRTVRVATTANLAALSGLLTIDGVTVVANDRVLVKDQTNAYQNGIYYAASGSWVRDLDMDTSAEVLKGLQIYVTEGSTQARTTYFLTTTGTITLNTTNLNFEGIHARGTTSGIWHFKHPSGVCFDANFEPGNLTLSNAGTLNLWGSTLSILGGVDYCIPVIGYTGDTDNSNWSPYFGDSSWDTQIRGTNVYIPGGNLKVGATTTGAPTALTITGQTTTQASTVGGSVTIQTGGGTNGTGVLTLKASTITMLQTDTTGGVGAYIVDLPQGRVRAGASTTGTGQWLYLEGQTTSSGAGGDVVLSTGYGTTRHGDIRMWRGGNTLQMELTTDLNRSWMPLAVTSDTTNKKFNTKIYNYRGTVSSASRVELFNDGSGRRIDLSSGGMWACQANIAGLAADGSVAAHFIFYFSILNNGGTIYTTPNPITGTPLQVPNGTGWNLGFNPTFTVSSSTLRFNAASYNSNGSTGTATTHYCCTLIMTEIQF